MAIRASEEAQRQEQLAVTEASAARVAESTARAAESEARFQQGEAENARATAEAQSTVIAEQKQIAEAQRSAARAQIFQSQRELYVSTLLAIDSLLKAPESPSPEAQEILRKNLSLLPQPVAQAAHLSRINSLELSPDGDTFITGSADFTACLWNIEDGKELFCVDSDESVNDVAFGLAGQLLVMGDDSGLVQIVNADDGVVESSFDFDAAVREISVQPGGNLIAAATGNGKIHILTLSEGERREVSTVETSSPLNVSAISPSGQWLAAGSTTGVITVWDLNSLRTPPGSYPRHKGEIRALSFNPRGNFIVTGASDKTAAVSTRSTGELVMAAINEDSVEDVAFSPDSSWFVTVSDDNRIRVWDLESGAERLRMLQEGDVTEVEISPNGRWIATTGSDETVRLWNAATGAELLQIPLEDPGSVLAFSPDSTRLISGDQGGAISIWDISAMTAPESYVTFNGLAANVQFSPSGNLMAASDARRIWLLNPESVSSQRLSTEDAEGISFRSNLKDVIVSPDAKWLGTLTEGGQVTLYGITDSSVRTLRIPSSVSAIAYSPDSLQLMTGDVTGNVQTWAVSNGSLLQELFQEERGVLGMAASQELLAVGFQDNIVIVDINSQEKLPGIQSPGDHSLLAFRADGSLLASMNSSGQVNVWEYQNGKFSAAGSFTRAQALSLALHPQESLIAVGTASEVYLVDFTTGEEIARIPHRDATRDLAFSPDGNILATASSGAIQLWDVARLRQLRIQADALIPTACSRIPLNFSDPEWGELFALCEDSQAQQSTNSP
jgi:WD40 repeat protein